MAKITRKGVSLYVTERTTAKGTEYQLVLGNKILSRHATEAEADAALAAEVEARKGRHTTSPAFIPSNCTA